MLVSMGAALFAMLAALATPGDSTAAGRILQGVAAGVGFIGAGAILKDAQRRDVTGLTSASSIWMAAAVGAAAGLRAYALALTAGILAFGILRATRQKPHEGPPD
jgi:putative Mg2+ transporter-C (MgtC) family protein